MSPQSYLMSGLNSSQLNPQLYRPQTGTPGSHNFYGATPPVIQHNTEDFRQVQKKGIHPFYGATPPVIQHSNDDDVEMTDN